MSVLVREALANERAGRWSKARWAWAAAWEAREISTGGRRARQTGLVHGQVLTHGSRWGVRAMCTYEVVDGPDGRREQFVYDGVAYPTASAAAAACAAALGCRGKYSGWIFWGIERRADARRITLHRS